MDLSFRTKKLRKLAESSKEQQKRLGTKKSKKFRARLDGLKTADGLADLAPPMPGRMHELTGDRDGQFSLDLDHPYRLIIEPDHDPVPEKEDGGMDWNEVTSVEIVEITDTHG